MFEFTDNEKADFILRSLGMSLFIEGKYEMTLVRGKDKPLFTKDSTLCYSIKNKETNKIENYIALYNPTETFKEFDADGNLILNMTYSEYLGEETSNKFFK